MSLGVALGGLVALLGPSGSGKTTLLRVLAGLEFAEAGRIVIGGQDVADVPARDRRIGSVFQHYALFRHMTVFDNVAIGLKVRPRAARPSKGEIRDRVTTLLDRMQIADLAAASPTRFRAGCGRGWRSPGRWRPSRASCCWLRRLHDDMGLTSILVTHDQEEAMDLADRVVLMDRGRIVQAGTPRAIRDRPATAFVQGFLGGANRFDVTVAGGLARFATAPLPPVAVALPDGTGVAYVEPHDLILSPGRGPGIVRRVTLAGPLLRVEFDLGGQAVEAQVAGEDTRTASLAPGVPVAVQARRIRVFGGGSSAVGVAVPAVDKSSPAADAEKKRTSIP